MLKRWINTCPQQQATHKQGFGALLTINIIFEVQFFVGGSVGKIPACV